MAGNLGINPNTVKKAYSELENKGVIQTISTKGTFISENVDIVKNNNNNLFSMWNNLIYRL